MLVLVVVMMRLMVVVSGVGMVVVVVVLRWLSVVGGGGDGCDGGFGGFGGVGVGVLLLLLVVVVMVFLPRISNSLSRCFAASEVYCSLRVNRNFGSTPGAYNLRAITIKWLTYRVVFESVGPLTPTGK